MDPKWFLYGFYMDPKSILYGFCMDPLRFLYGSYMDPIWILYGFYMDPIWILYGSYMDPIWILYCIRAQREENFFRLPPQASPLGQHILYYLREPLGDHPNTTHIEGPRDHGTTGPRSPKSEAGVAMLVPKRYRGPYRQAV